jgi:hypothetical protein
MPCRIPVFKWVIAYINIQTVLKTHIETEVGKVKQELKEDINSMNRKIENVQKSYDSLVSEKLFAKLCMAENKKVSDSPIFGIAVWFSQFTVFTFFGSTLSESFSCRTSIRNLTIILYPRRKMKTALQIYVIM